MGGDQHLWWGTKGDERFLHSEKPDHGREVSWGHKGTFGGSQGNSATCLWGAEPRKNCAHSMCCCPVHPSLSCVSPAADRGRMLESGVWRVDAGRRTLLAAKRKPEGTEIRNFTTRKISEEVQSTIDARCHHWVAHKGQGHHCHSLPHLQALLPTSWPLPWEKYPSEQTHPFLKPRLPLPAQAPGSWILLPPKPVLTPLCLCK